MSKYLRPLLLISVFGLFACETTSTSKLHADTLQTDSTLVDFSSDEGIKRFAASDAKVDFFTLANQFEGQSNGLYCGPTTTAIILNSFRMYKGISDLPKDRSRLSTDDTKYLPKGFDPAVARYTQESIFDKSPKPRANVLGKPVKHDGKDVSDFGYQLRQLDGLFKAQGLKTTLRIVDDKLADDTIVSEMVENLKRRGDFVVVNYKRSEVGQQGGGHISPVGAYDAESNSFLILDVNPAKASWVWMPAATLIKGMRSLDTIENRGYITVSDAK